MRLICLGNAILYPSDSELFHHGIVIETYQGLLII